MKGAGQQRGSVVFPKTGLHPLVHVQRQQKAAAEKQKEAVVNYEAEDMKEAFQKSMEFLNQVQYGETSKNFWNLIYQGLLSTQNNKYTDYMNNALEQYRSDKTQEEEKKKEDGEQKRQQQISKEFEKVRELKNKEKNSDSSSSSSSSGPSKSVSLQSFESGKSGKYSVLKGSQTRKREESASFIQKSRRGKQTSRGQMVQFTSQDTSQNFHSRKNSMSSMNNRNNSAYKRRISKHDSIRIQTSLFSFLKKPSGMNAGPQQRAGIVIQQPQHLLKSVQELSPEKKNRLKDQILNGVRNSQAQLLYLEIAQSKEMSSLAKKAEPTEKERKILEIFLKDKLKGFPFISDNPHERVDLDRNSFVDFNQYDTLAKYWNYIDKYSKCLDILEPTQQRQVPTFKKQRSISYAEDRSLQFVVENHHKKKSSTISASEVYKQDINQYIRRRSCCCNFCGYNPKNYNRMRQKEILLEPMYPFAKTKEQLAYEKRLLKRTKTLQGFKRMSLETFKNTLQKQVPVFDKDDFRSDGGLSRQQSLDESVDWARDGTPRKISEELPVQDQKAIEKRISTDPPSEEERKGPVKKKSSQLLQANLGLSEQDVELFHNSLEKIRKNSELIRGTGQLISFVQEKYSKLTAIKATNNLITYRDPKQALLDAIQEEDDMPNYPLYRSVRLYGSNSKLSTIVRNEKTLDAMINKKESMKTLQMLQSVSDEIGSPFLPKFFKLQTELHRFGSTQPRPSRILERPPTLANLRFRESLETDLNGPEEIEERSSDESSSCSKSGSSLKTSIKSFELNYDYIQVQLAKNKKIQQKQKFKKMVHNDFIKGATNIDVGHSDRLQKMIRKINEEKYYKIKEMQKKESMPATNQKPSQLPYSKSQPYLQFSQQPFLGLPRKTMVNQFQTQAPLYKNSPLPSQRRHISQNNQRNFINSPTIDSRQILRSSCVDPPPKPLTGLGKRKLSTNQSSRIARTYQSRNAPNEALNLCPPLQHQAKSGGCTQMVPTSKGRLWSSMVQTQATTTDVKPHKLSKIMFGRDQQKNLLSSVVSLKQQNLEQKGNTYLKKIRSQKDIQKGGFASYKTENIKKLNFIRARNN